MPAGGNTSNIDWSAIPDEAEKPIASLVDESLSGRLPANKKNIVMAQLRHETGRGELDSNVAKKNNNVSGITWNKNFPKEWKGTPRPASEGGYYVHFPTIDDWAEKHLELLHKDAGAGAPIDADDVETFAKRLKKNGYYTAPEAQYISGMQGMMSKYGNSDNSVDWNAIPDEADIPSVEKKSPDVSASGLAANSQTGPGDSSQNNSMRHPVAITSKESDPAESARYFRDLINQKHQDNAQSLQSANTIVQHTLLPQQSEGEQIQYAPMSGAVYAGNIRPEAQSAARRVNEQLNKEIEDIHDQGLKTIGRQIVHNTPKEKIADPTTGMYSPTRLGMETAAFMGDNQALEDLRVFDRGREVTPEAKYKYDQLGFKSLLAAENAERQDGNHALADEINKGIGNVDERLKKENQKHFDKINAGNIANRIYKEHDGIFEGLFGRGDITDEELRSAAQKEGVNAEDLNRLNKKDIPKRSGLILNSMQGLVNSVGAPMADALYERIKGEKSNLGTYFVGEQPSVSGDISSDNKLGILSKVGESLAGLYGMGKAIKGVQALGAGEKLATGAVFFANGFTDAYHNAPDVLKKDDEGNVNELGRIAYATLTGAVDAALFTAHSPTNLLDPAKWKGDKEVLSIVDKIMEKGVRAFEDKGIEEGLSTAIYNAAKGTTGELGKQIGLMDASHVAHQVINMLSNPDRTKEKIAAGESFGRQATEGIGTETLNTAVTMLIPSLVHGTMTERHRNPLIKSTMMEVGLNPQNYINEVARRLDKGKISDQEATDAYSAINRVHNVFANEVPTTNEVTGGKLTQSEAGDYGFNVLQAQQLEDKLRALPEKSANVDLINKKIKELQADNTKILENAKVPDNEVAFEEQNQGETDERSVATEAQSEEEAPAAKEKEKKVVNSEKEDIPLLSDNVSDKDVTKKTTENEQQSNEREVKEREQNGTERTSTENERPNSEVQEAANDGLRNEGEDSKIRKVEKEEIKQAAPQTEQPIVVKGKRKREKIIYDEEVADIPVEEAKPEIKAVEQSPVEEIVIGEPIKEEENAGTQSEEQQQEGTQQGGEREYARAEQARSEEATASTENSDSPVGGEAEEVAQPEAAPATEIPEGFTAKKSNETRKDGKRIFTKEDGDISHEIVVKKDGTAQVETVNKLDFSGVDEKSKTAPADIQNFDSLEEAVKHVNEYKPSEKINSEPADERSVATAAQSETETTPPKRTVKDVDNDIVKEKASLKDQIEKGKTAEKDRIKAMRSSDSEQIAKAVAEVNRRKDFVLKKQDKIERLSKERDDVIRAHREETTRESYKNTADKIRSFGDKMAAGSEGMLMSGTPINPKVLRQLTHLVADGVELTGNLHIAFDAAIRKLIAAGEDVVDLLKNRREIEEDMFSYMRERPKFEPELPTTHKKFAQELKQDIEVEEITYEEAREEIKEKEFAYGPDRPYSEEASDRAKAQILNYLDWHNFDIDENNNELANPEHKSTIVKDYEMKQSDAWSRMISGETIELRTGDKPMNPQEVIKYDLALTAQDSQRIVSLMKHQFGTDVLDWAPEMLKQIEDIDPSDTPKKTAVLVSLMDELRKDRGIYEYELTQLTDSPKDVVRRKEVNRYLSEIPKLLKAAERPYQELLRNASKTMNGARNMAKLFSGEYAKKVYADEAVLSTKTKTGKDEFEAKKDKKISDKILKEGPVKDRNSADKEIEAAQRPESKKSKTVASRLKDMVTNKKIKDKAKIEKLVKQAEENLKKKGMDPDNMFSKIKELIKKNPC